MDTPTKRRVLFLVLRSRCNAGSIFLFRANEAFGRARASSTAIARI